jgi:MFS family permease
VAALISYPAGFLSVQLGRRNILLVSYAIFLATYLGFAVTRNVALIAALFILYGLYQGIFRSVGKALASDYVPEQLRASGIGWYNTIVGLFGLVASLVAGSLWDQVGHAAVFLFGAGFAVVGGIALLALVPETARHDAAARRR